MTSLNEEKTIGLGKKISSFKMIEINHPLIALGISTAACLVMGGIGYWLVIPLLFQ